MKLAHYAYTNQGGEISGRSRSPLQFPSTLLGIPVGMVAYLSEAILVRAHILEPMCFLMRICLLDPS